MVMIAGLPKTMFIHKPSGDPKAYFFCVLYFHGGDPMAGLSSADIFSILEEEIGKNDKELEANDPKSDGEIIIQNSANPGTIVQTGSDTGNNNSEGSRNKVITHDFSKSVNEAPAKPESTGSSSQHSELAATGTDDVQGYNPSTDHKEVVKESRGAKMKKTLRIRQVGDQISVRVFVNGEELCGMALTKEAGNSISLAGVNLYIDGEETVLEV
jgi:hypothetical protein